MKTFPKSKGARTFLSDNTGTEYSMETIRRNYQLVISLGLTCQTAYQLGRLGLRSSSGPLDWFITPFDSVIGLLNDKFAGFMERESLEIIGTFNKKWILRDCVYGVKSYHDFPVNDAEEISHQSYQEFKEKVDRRVDRFLTQMGTLDSILFVIHNGPPVVEEYYPLIEALEKLRNGRYFHVLASGILAVCNEHKVDLPISFHRFTRLDLSLLERDRWQGCDANWDQFLKDITLDMLIS